MLRVQRSTATAQLTFVGVFLRYETCKGVTANPRHTRYFACGCLPKSTGRNARRLKIGFREGRRSRKRATDARRESRPFFQDDPCRRVGRVNRPSRRLFPAHFPIYGGVCVVLRNIRLDALACSAIVACRACLRRFSSITSGSRKVLSTVTNM